jgi:hypothetical protein
MGGACSMHRKDEKYNMLENLKGRGHLEFLGINGRIILDWILEK